MRKAFTLIELLVVIAIIAVLAVIVVLILNPAELLRQSRDANRVSDMDTLSHALSLYQTDQGGSAGYTMGNASSVYVSLPDSSPICASWSLPALPAGYSYQCASSQNYRNTNSTGWIPVNLASTTTGSPLGSLPIDPTNTSSTGLYYTYYAAGDQYEVTSLFESQKYKTQYAQNPIDPNYPEVDAKGSSLSVSPIFNPSGLVGWWPMDEGSGSSTIDASGNGNAGMWSGSSTNGSYYTGGKVGAYAGIFNGSNNYVQINDAPSLHVTSSLTVSMWYYVNSFGLYNYLIAKDNRNGGFGLRLSSGVMRSDGLDASGHCGMMTYTAPLNSWDFVTLTAAPTSTGTTWALYRDGVLQNQLSCSYVMSTADAMTMGAVGGNYWNGFLDGVRIYNRALSTAEIQALYNAEK